MKKLLFFIMYLSTLPIFSNDRSKEFLMGSVVKSDEWEIDRKNNIEYFKKNVYFKNYYYTMKSDYAAYDRNNKIWNIKGNIYYKKKFDDNSFLEIFCDKTTYIEKDEKANLFSNTRVKMIYFDILKKERYIAYSKKAETDNNYKKIYFDTNFEIKVSSINAYSDYSVYDDINKTFELTSNPSVIGYDEKYRVYIQGERIVINKTDLIVYVKKNVFGVLKSKSKENKK